MPEKRGKNRAPCPERPSNDWSIVFHPSIVRPEAGSGEFDEVIVGIAEVDALAAGFPTHAALNRNLRLGQALFPRGEIFGGNRKGKMEMAGAIVRGNHAAGKRNRLKAAAAAEEQQDAVGSRLAGGFARGD